MKKDSDEIATAYNLHGRDYHASRQNGGRLFNEFLDMPATLSLIPTQLKDYKILDAGCGSGIYSRILAGRGAQVVGIDISSTMIEIAKEEKQADETIEYVVGDISNIHLPNESIDLIICNYVLENIAALAPVFEEFYRILKPQAVCIYSISHPLRAMAKREISDSKETWLLDNYFDNTTRISDFGHGLKVKKYKRTLSQYIDAGVEAGFAINKICEPIPVAEGKQQDPKAYEIATRLPQLLITRMIKK